MIKFFTENKIFRFFGRSKNMSSNKLTFYYHDISSPCRSIGILTSYLDLKLDKKFVDITVGDNLKPEFVKINPQKTVPFIVDGDLSLNQSRAQLAYLVNKYAPESNLYPSDPNKRALVDNALYFDATCLYASFFAIYGGIIKDGVSEIDPELIKRLENYLELLNNDLKKSKYVASDDHFTIADITLFTTCKSIESTEFVNLSKYNRICSWIDNLIKKEFKNWNSEYEEPNKQFGQMIKTLLAANKSAKK